MDFDDENGYESDDSVCYSLDESVKVILKNNPIPEGGPWKVTDNQFDYYARKALEGNRLSTDDLKSCHLKVAAITSAGEGNACIRDPKCGDLCANKTRTAEAARAEYVELEAELEDEENISPADKR